jgi:hypothetical protein
MNSQSRHPFGEALDKLERAAAKSKPSTGPQPDVLMAEEIKLAPAVFQPRIIEGAMGADADHLRELARGLRALGKGGVLEPILVMQIGKAAYCVDGHHRLAAYRNEKVGHAVPVEWFSGSIREAVVETAKRNARDRLPMRRQEKLEVAWRMTVLGGHSKANVAGATTVALATIGTMRKTLKAILAEQSSDDEDSSDFGKPLGIEPRNMTWEEAKAHGKAEPHRNDEWEDEIARKWAGQLARAFGGQWRKQPRVAAKAIDFYAEGLSRSLIEEWIDEARDVVAAVSE